MGKKIKRAIIIVISILLIIVVLFVGLVAFLLRNTGVKHYDSLDAFQTEFHSEIYAPEGAEDLKLAINNKVAAKIFMVSYIVDDDELEALTQRIMQEKYTKTGADGSTEVVPDAYYGVRVSEIDAVNAGYTSDDFQHWISFDAVIEDSVEDYTVLYYYPILTGTTSKGVFYNEKTNRVLEYYYGALR